MSTPTFARRENLEVIEEYYRRWVADPASVDDRWQAFFEGFELAGAGSGPAGASGRMVGPGCVSAAGLQ